MQKLARLAGYFAAHGLWCLGEEQRLAPLIVCSTEDDEIEFGECVDERPDVGIQRAQRWLAENPKLAPRLAVVYEVLYGPDDQPGEALLVSARKAPDGGKLEVLVPYRSSDATSAFAVGRPRILELEDGDPTETAEAFLAGLSTHQHGSSLLASHLDTAL